MCIDIWSRHSVSLCVRHISDNSPSFGHDVAYATQTQFTHAFVWWFWARYYAFRYTIRVAAAVGSRSPRCDTDDGCTFFRFRWKSLDGSGFLLVRLAPFSFNPSLLHICLPTCMKGECAPYCCLFCSGMVHLLSLRKVLSPGHSGKVRFALHLALPMSCRGDVWPAA